MGKLSLFGLAGLLLSLVAHAQAVRVSQDDCSSVSDPAKRALCLGLHPATTPYIATPYSPFVRMIRDNGTAPLDVHACVQMDVIAGVGHLKMANGTLYDANPYPYIGFEMEFGSDPQNLYDEYIEAGLGYIAKTDAHPAYFAPYLRRAPDELDVNGEIPPTGFHNATRNGNPLPGYWIALDEPDKMMSEDGGLCFTYSFDPKSNYYTFDFEVSKTLAGPPFHATLKMASARFLHNGNAVQPPIHSFASRILTSVAITHDDFHPEDPAYSGMVFGANWKASARDQSDPTGAWVPYDSAHFETINSDPTGRIIFYRLDPLN
jgi:hypothetical protein